MESVRPCAAAACKYKPSKKARTTLIRCGYPRHQSATVTTLISGRRQKERLSPCLKNRTRDSTIALIEGNKGLHDGLNEDGHDSNAALAKLLKTPVILTLDTRGTIRGVAPLVLGYQQFDPDVKVAGIILNLVGGDRHAVKLTNMIERYTDIPVLGTVHRNKKLALVERYLGLQPSNEDQLADQHIAEISKIVEDQVDLDHVVTIANTVLPLTSTADGSSEEIQKLRIENCLC